MEKNPPNGVSPPPARAWREAKGRGLRETARRAQIDCGYLQRIEVGKSQPSVKVLYRLAVALDLHGLARVLRPWVKEPE